MNLSQATIQKNQASHKFRFISDEKPSRFGMGGARNTVAIGSPTKRADGLDTSFKIIDIP